MDVPNVSIVHSNLIYLVIVGAILGKTVFKIPCWRWNTVAAQSGSIWSPSVPAVQKGTGRLADPARTARWWPGTRRVPGPASQSERASFHAR